MRGIEEEVDCAARSNAKVLLTGESGVGKEVVARLIHQRSARAHSPLVTINCAGVPDTLLESELFGHMRGSFTDAHRDRKGWLEQAHFGTVFMDEIGEMSLRMQALLLRFLENGEIQRVGSDRTKAVVDVRVIAATNRNLLARVADKSFREDLYYRLNVIHIPIPPLRDQARRHPALVQALRSHLQQDTQGAGALGVGGSARASDGIRLAGKRTRVEERRRARRYPRARRDRSRRSAEGDDGQAVGSRSPR